MPLRTIAGFKVDHELWLKCQWCERLVRTGSEWIKWWLVAERLPSRRRREKYMIRCPEHITREAMMTCGAPGARSKGFKLMMVELKEHYDDDPQPSGDVPIVFPNKEEFEYFKNTPFNIRW